MRRLRNLVVCTLMTRDLAGLADLSEVVETMSALAEFALRTHLQALQREMIALHGTPTGEESGAPQELIVLGMGKLGGRELDVSSDIDLILAYAEDGTTALDSASNHNFPTTNSLPGSGKS